MNYRGSVVDGLWPWFCRALGCGLIAFALLFGAAMGLRCGKAVKHKAGVEVSR